jgi:hypothetical protein
MKQRASEFSEIRAKCWLAQNQRELQEKVLVLFSLTQTSQTTQCMPLLELAIPGN